MSFRRFLNSRINRKKTIAWKIIAPASAPARTKITVIVFIKYLLPWHVPASLLMLKILKNLSAFKVRRFAPIPGRSPYPDLDLWLIHGLKWSAHAGMARFIIHI
jgi:hypothetical protein